MQVGKLTLIVSGILVSAALFAGCRSYPQAATPPQILSVAKRTWDPSPTRSTVSSAMDNSDIVGSRPLKGTGESIDRSLRAVLKTTASQQISVDQPDPAFGSVQRVNHNQETPTLFVDDGPAAPLHGQVSVFQGSAKATAAESHAQTLTSPPSTTATRIAELGLTDVLAMAGADNWSVLLANERICEAQAKYDAAKVLWLPSLNAGVGFTKHDGQIQDTRGDVIDVSRNSLFAGGGAVTANAPTAAGSGGPARMFVDLSLADAIFLPRSTQHLLNARQSASHATFNDTLLDAALAYYEVVRSQQQLALADENLTLLKNLLKDTTTFEASGKGTQADISRVEVQVERRNQDVVQADMSLQIASAELARLLRIPLEGQSRGVAIFAKDAQPLPVHFIAPNTPLKDLTAQAIAARPEINELAHRSEAVRQTVLAEQWRPWIPSLHAGVSTGGFGGGAGSDLNSLDGRADVDLLAVWQVRNLGFGTRAARDDANSRQRQTQYAYYRMREIIIADVSKAHAEVDARQRQLKLAGLRVKKARDAHKRSLARIRGFVGLPLEALQDVQAVITARQDIVNATVDYNQAQLKLLRSIGRTAAVQ